MKISKLYSNLDEKMEPILFNDGLNIVLGEIRLPENKDKDTHNLGKTTLGLLIDYCLLKGRSKTSFLFKHLDIFKEDCAESGEWHLGAVLIHKFLDGASTIVGIWVSEPRRSR